MDFRNDWFNVQEQSTYFYTIKCPCCSCEMKITQKGKDISKVIFQVIKLVHQNDVYDSLTSFIGDILVNADIENNRKCCQSARVPST